MAVSDSSHIENKVSFTLQGPGWIFACINSMPCGYLPYLSRQTPYTHNQCHSWSLVISMMAGSICLAALSMVSLSVSSSMLPVGVVPSRPLWLPFSLYTSRWSRTYERTFWVPRVTFSTSTMFAASLHTSTFASTARRKSIVTEGVNITTEAK